MQLHVCPRFNASVEEGCIILTNFKSAILKAAAVSYLCNVALLCNLKACCCLRNEGLSTLNLSFFWSFSQVDLTLSVLSVCWCLLPCLVQAIWQLLVLLLVSALV